MAYRRFATRVLDLLRAHRWRLFTLFLGVGLPLYVFGALADEILEKEDFGFDEPLLRYAYSLATPARDQFMLWMSRFGYQYGVVPLDIGILLFLVLRQRRRDSVFFGLAVIGAAVLNQSAKLLFGRVRPKLWESIAPEQTFSFPSGHAMGSMALVTALVVLAWPTRWRWPTLVLGSLFVLLVSFSRIYLGVHYPSDILAGWAASLGWVLGVSLVLYRQLTKPVPVPV